VTKSDLWLTDARFSNDAEELEHGRSLIASVVKKQIKRGPPKVRALARDVAAQLEADAKRPAGPSDAVFVCCFCEKSDLLSQWRGYAANGGGVAIEIDPKAFGYIARTDCPIGVMRFWKVFYQDEQKRSRVEQVLAFWAGQSVSRAVRAESTVATLRFFMPTFKNPRFAEEVEWRLIFTPGPTCHVPPKFRTARGLLVPYFELIELVKSAKLKGLAIKRLAIKSVCVGPGPYKDVNLRSARMLLDSYGFQNAAVVPSEIPYRG